MVMPVVAKIWWEAPHRGLLERFMVESDVITFGRAGGCSIQVGHAPVPDPIVPRWWGEITWHRGAALVSNLSTRWGFDLVPVGAPVAGRIAVPPGAAGSSPVASFQIFAQAPEVTVTLNVQTAPPRRGQPSLASDQDAPSFVPFALTPTQKLVGAAVIAPLLAGRPRRASYAEVAAATHYAERTVREAVAAMDGLFIVHRLVDAAGPGDALDRVAHALRLHTTLLEQVR